MSTSSERGKTYEIKIRKITERKLRLEVARDSRSGAGWVHKADIRDRYNEIPLSIEIKDQETLKPKEWFRDAADKASFNQMPAVVFPMDTEDLVLMRYTDVLQLIREMMDYKEEIADLRNPAQMPSGKRDWQGQGDRAGDDPGDNFSVAKPIKTAAQAAEQIQRVAAKRTTLLCPAGHIADESRRCQWKGCKYNRTYKAKKEAKK